jgi:hypothetical protein
MSARAVRRNRRVYNSFLSPAVAAKKEPWVVEPLYGQAIAVVESGPVIPRFPPNR